MMKVRNDDPQERHKIELARIIHPKPTLACRAIARRLNSCFSFLCPTIVSRQKNEKER